MAELSDEMKACTSPEELESLTKKRGRKPKAAAQGESKAENAPAPVAEPQPVKDQPKPQEQRQPNQQNGSQQK